MFQRYLERIEKIASFLAQAPHPDQSLDYLSLNISPIDEVSVAFRGIVDSDGMIRCENIHGFSKYEMITTTQFKLSDQRPISAAARTQKMVWARRATVQEEFPDFSTSIAALHGNPRLQFRWDLLEFIALPLWRIIQIARA